MQHPFFAWVQIVARNARPFRPQGRLPLRLRSCAALALVVLGLSACGQRGPLYLPDETPRKTAS